MASVSKIRGFLLWLSLVSVARAFRAHLGLGTGSNQRFSPVVAAGTPDAQIITGQEHQGGLSLSPLVTDIVESKTIAVHSMTMAMKARGEEVVSLAVGEPDFDPPQAILDATAEALKTGKTRYTAVAGTLPLRKAIAAHLLERKGTSYDPASEILLCNGAKQAVYEAVLATCRPGDEVIIPAPYWTSYPEIVKLAGAVPVIVDTTREDDYKLMPWALAAAMGPRTRMLIFCNPSNPTGAVHSASELEALAGVLARAPFGDQVWVLADEIYERLVYDGEEHVSFAAVSAPSSGFQGGDKKGGNKVSMWDRTLIVNGFSKAYAMTGFRLGYLAGPSVAVKACATLQGQITSCASSLAQAGAEAALQLSDDDLAPLVSQMVTKRDLVYGKLASMPGLKLPSQPPSGAFYLLPDVGSFYGSKSAQGASLEDSTSFCVALLAETGVALVPGDAFGAPTCVRISYATSVADLELACDRLGEFLATAVKPPRPAPPPRP